jgi:radical SAM protein with 4Fe4S-binding SPASM domain
MLAVGGVKRNPNVVWREETRGGTTDGIVLFNYETRTVHYLEGHGKKIWEQCEGTAIDELVRKIGAEGNESDVDEFLKKLEERRLVLTHNIDSGHSSSSKTDMELYQSGVGMWSNRVYFDVPLFVQFDCTNRCNLRCKHCVTKGGEPFDGELSTNEALKLIRTLGRLGIFQIGFSGGEPLTRNDLFTLMQEAKNLGMKVQLTTNAILVDEESAKKLSRLEPITVGVSLEGGNRESYEFFRGKGNFDSFLKGVKTMKKFGLPVKFKTAILRKNLGEIDSIINLAIELGVEAVDMFLFYPQGRGEEFTDEKLNPEEIREFLTLLSKKRKELEGTITIDVDDKPNAFLVDPSLSHSTCGAGVYWAEVLPTGEVVPCIFFSEVSAGNIKEEDFKDAWDSKIWESFRDRRELSGRCGSCVHLDRCGGGCRANGYALTGDFLAEDTMCWYAEKTRNP